MRILAAILFFALLPLPAFAWGAEGHEVVAHIAAMELNSRARAAVATLLGGEAEAMMAIDSNWADEIRDDRPETSTWHYVNIEIDDPVYVPSRDCPREACVVAQIARDIRILRSNATGPVKAEALKYLIHFAGDIHQPLHAGERHDQGGNRVPVRYRGHITNLHHIWDDEVVAVQGRNPIALARAIHASLPSALKTQAQNTDPRDWALESAAIARDRIYVELPGGSGVMRMGEGYPQDHAALARLQLAKAGLRLAVLLNAIFR